MIWLKRIGWMCLGACLWSGLYIAIFTGESYPYWEKKTINGWGVRNTGTAGKLVQWYVIDENYKLIDCSIWVYQKLEDGKEKPIRRVLWCKYSPGTWKIPKPYIYEIEFVVSKE